MKKKICDVCGKEYEWKLKVHYVKDKVYCEHDGNENPEMPKPDTHTPLTKI